MHSVQDERLDPLKRKSGSVYIVGSDNDFFFCFFGVSFKHINNSVSPLRFFFFLLLLCRGAAWTVKCRCVCSRRLQMKSRLLKYEK